MELTDGTQKGDLRDLKEKKPLGAVPTFPAEQAVFASQDDGFAPTSWEINNEPIRIVPRIMKS